MVFTSLSLHDANPKIAKILKVTVPVIGKSNDLTAHGLVLNLDEVTNDVDE